MMADFWANLQEHPFCSSGAPFEQKSLLITRPSRDDYGTLLSSAPTPATICQQSTKPFLEKPKSVCSGKIEPAQWLSMSTVSLAFSNSLNSTLTFISPHFFLSILTSPSILTLCWMHATHLFSIPTHSPFLCQTLDQWNCA